MNGLTGLTGDEHGAGGYAPDGLRRSGTVLALVAGFDMKALPAALARAGG